MQLKDISEKTWEIQRCLWGDIFNQSPGRRHRDLQISPPWDVSEKLYEMSQRYIWDASMPAGERNWSKFLKAISQDLFGQKSWNFQEFHFSIIQTNAENFIKFCDDTQRKFSKFDPVGMEWPLTLDLLKVVF